MRAVVTRGSTHASSTAVTVTRCGKAHVACVNVSVRGDTVMRPPPVHRRPAAQSASARHAVAWKGSPLAASAQKPSHGTSDTVAVTAASSPYTKKGRDVSVTV